MRLAEVPRIVVAAPEMLQQFPPVHEVKDLARLPWLALNMFYRNEALLTDARSGEHVQFPVMPRLSSNSLYAVRRAVLDGLGAALDSAWRQRGCAGAAFTTADARLAGVAAADLSALSVCQLLSHPPASVYGADARRYAAHQRHAAASIGIKLCIVPLVGIDPATGHHGR